MGPNSLLQAQAEELQSQLQEAKEDADRLGRDLAGEEGDVKAGGEVVEAADGDRVRDQGAKAGPRGRGGRRGRRLTSQGGGGEQRGQPGSGTSAAALQQQVAVQEEKVRPEYRMSSALYIAREA